MGEFDENFWSTLFSATTLSHALKSFLSGPKDHGGPDRLGGIKMLFLIREHKVDQKGEKFRIQKLELQPHISVAKNFLKQNVFFWKGDTITPFYVYGNCYAIDMACFKDTGENVSVAEKA